MLDCNWETVTHIENIKKASVHSSVWFPSAPNHEYTKSPIVSTLPLLILSGIVVLGSQETESD